MVLDLAELTYISSAGVGEFVHSARLLKETGGRFCLANVPARVRSVFDMCGLGGASDLPLGCRRPRRLIRGHTFNEAPGPHTNYAKI